MMDDVKVERIIGTLLRTGVILTAFIVVAGGAVYLSRHGAETPHYRVFRGEPSDLRGVPGVVTSARTLHGRNIIQLGLLFLIATPIARVLFSVGAFALEKDRAYVVITLIVLAVLLWSLAGG